MKTPMNVFNTVMKKKKKNRKGFSLVELIVVLVIMAILAAALVPTLVGYIRQTRQSNAKNEASSCVSAMQTISSSAFASAVGASGGQYTSNQSGKTISISFPNTASGSATLASGTADDLKTCIADLSETSKGNIIAVTVDENAKVSGLIYDDGTTAVKYADGKYEAKSAGTNHGGYTLTGTNMLAASNTP